MTDEVTPQAHPSAKKEEKKPTSSANNRGGAKRNVSNPRAGGNANSTQGNARPSSRTSNKKAGPGPESGSESASRKGPESAKKPEQRKNPSSGNRSQPSHRKASASQAVKRESKSSPAPPPQTNESSDALSSLQRVIADLKTTSPQPPANPGPVGMPTSHITSNLPVNAPVFQPGNLAFGGMNNNLDPKHRKAQSMGASGLSGNFNSFSPHLGSMMEDAEDASGALEEGEIPGSYYTSPGHQMRSQSQSFTAPRFAALAAQQEHNDQLGPSGRPQLAPNFMFGAKKRTSGMGPPINEDVGFQFPQQQQTYQEMPSTHESGHRKSDSGEITGIMAEQVRATPIFLSKYSLYDARSPSRIKSRRFNNSNRRCISINSPQTRFSPSRRLGLPPIVTDVSRVLLQVWELVHISIRLRILWASSTTWVVLI